MEQWELHWQDYYEILQISLNAEPDVIEWTYKKLALKYHPDKPTGDEARMKVIAEAYTVLCDASRRRRYDAAYRERRQAKFSKAANREAERDKNREQTAWQQAEAARKSDELKWQKAEKELKEALRKEREARRRAEDAECKAREKELKKETERPAQVLRDQEPHQEQKSPGLWDALLKIGAAVLADRFQSSGPTPTFEPMPVILTGEWLSHDGVPHGIWQSGNQVRVQARDPLGAVIMDGTGTFDGCNLHVSYQTVPRPTFMEFLPTFGEARCQVSSDGCHLRGQAINHTTGQVFNIRLYR